MSITTFDEYEEEALKTEMKVPQDLGFRDLVLKNALGCAGEAGEVAEMVKKWAFHGKGPLDKEKFRKELGDVLWYVTALARTQGWTLQEVAQENVNKLVARYPDGVYSHQACAERKDGG